MLDLNSAMAFILLARVEARENGWELITSFSTVGHKIRN